MICPECGSYQPDRAKYCGICGAGLSQDGLVERFLKSDSEHEIVLPRHRSPLFYSILVGIILLVLAAFGGAGYLVYRVAWGNDESKSDDVEVEETTEDYTDPELGFYISYPETWSLEQAIPGDDELAALTFTLTSRKNIEMCIKQLDPIVAIGGIGAIEEYLAEDAAERMLALGGQPDSGTVSQPSGEAGYGQEEPAAEEPGGEMEAGETEGMPTEDMLTSTRVSDFPAFYTEFSANYMGEETKFLLYYIVAGDYIFIFRARSPANEFEDMRPQFFSIVRSFTWEDILNGQNPENPEEIPGVSSTPAPVIICT